MAVGRVPVVLLVVGIVVGLVIGFGVSAVVPTDSIEVDPEFQALKSELERANFRLSNARVLYTCCPDIARAAAEHGITLTPYDGLIYDAHIHTGVYGSIENLILALDEAGISKAVLLGGVDLGILPAEIAQQAPDRFILWSTWSLPLVISPQFDRPVDEVRAELESGVFKGVGEVGAQVELSGAPVDALLQPADPQSPNRADDPRVLAIADLAAEMGVPMTVHSDNVQQLEGLLAHNRGAKVIWSHAGQERAQYPSEGYITPSEYRQLFERHPNLYADLAGAPLVIPPGHPASLVNQDGTINPQWKQLFEDFPDRFLVGSSLETDPDKTKDAITFFRYVLGQLDSDVAERIAYKNLEEMIAS